MKWAMSFVVALGLLAGSGCSKTDEKIGRLEARIEALEAKAASQNAGTATVVQQGAAR